MRKGAIVALERMTRERRESKEEYHPIPDVTWCISARLQLPTFLNKHKTDRCLLKKGCADCPCKAEGNRQSSSYHSGSFISFPFGGKIPKHFTNWKIKDKPTSTL